MRGRSIGYWIFVFAFGFYLHGLYPSVSVGDSGEFITAAHTLGIPHEPGYPTYTLVTHALTSLIPFGNIGYRQNLTSALASAGAAALLYECLLMTGLSVVAAIIGAGLFLAAPACMASAQASEVFALNGLFAIGAIAALSAGALPLSGLLFGLGMGNHQTLMLLFPAVGWWMWKHRESARIQLAVFVGFFILGLAIYLALYLRAAKHPFLNIGHPDTLGDLWRVFRRADYGSTTLALGKTPDRTLANTGLQSLRFISGLATQLTWPGLAAFLVGWVIALRKNKAVAELLLVAFLFLGPFFFLLANLPFDAQSAGLLERFYIAPVLCGCAVISWTIDALPKRWNGLGWIAALLLIPLLFQRSLAETFRNDFSAWSYGRNNLRSLPPNAVLLMDGGDDTFYTLAYLTQVEGRRSDIELHDRGAVVFGSFYGSDFRQLDAASKEARRQEVEAAAITALHPLYYSTMNDKLLKGVELKSQGILYASAAAPHDTSALWAAYDLRGAAPWDASSFNQPKDYRTRALVPYYAFQRAILEGAHGNWKAAPMFLSSAHSVGPDVLWLTPNCLTTLHLWAFHLYMVEHQPQLAIAFYDLLLLWDPTDVTAWTNRGAICEAMNNPSEAINDYQKAISLDPMAEQPRFDLAVCYWKQSRWADVVEQFQRVLEINPKREDARHYLMAAQKHLQEGHS